MAHGLPGEPGVPPTPDAMEDTYRLSPKWRELKRRAGHYDALVEALRRCTKLLALLADRQAPEYRGEHNAIDEVVASARAVLAQIAAKEE